jgi:Tfp pilus assembly PilM family ATPase
VECFARLFRRPTDAHRTVLYVDMGTTSTQVVLAHAQKIVFAKNLTFGGHQLDEAVAGGLNVETSQAAQIRRQLTEAGQVPPEAEAELYHLLDGPLERLSQELTQCMRYYDSVFRNHAVERVIFIGGQAYDKRFCQAVAQRLNLPAQIGDPLLRVNRAAGAGLEGNRPRPDWAVAVGLSLGANIAA